ncbi:MAG: glycosyltransferase [Bacteroidota bacterium]
MKKALFIGHIWPEPKTTAAGHRMLQLLNAFKQKEYRVIFATTATKTDYTADLDAYGIETVSIKLNDSGFDRWIQELRPDVVIFDRFMVEEQFGWRVAESVPVALRVLNTEDLHSLRDTRATCQRNNTEFTTMKWRKNDKTKREIASCYRCDLTLVVSTFEMALLQDELQMPKGQSLHLPLFYEPVTKEKTMVWPSFERRRDFVCIGNGRHAPNVDAVQYLKEIIWPLIREQLPQAKLHVYGAYMPSHICQMNNPKKGFLVHGWAEDIAGVLQHARVQLAPLRFGAGIKGKLLDAMQNGIPSITTTIGAEGMNGSGQWGGAIADSVKKFAERAIALYTSEQAWIEAQQNAIDLLNGHYAKNVNTKKLFDKIDLLTENLEIHRTTNFTGAMLQHQTMASTKYLAKWIEEKNQKT